MDKFKKICKNIKFLKIQGATNVAKAAIEAYLLKPSKRSKKILISLRPTEPLLINSLNLIKKYGQDKILEHFQNSQNKINTLVFKIIKNNSTIFTHCHSSTVSKSLIYAKKQGKKFQVYNTETRPLYQGRITAGELAKAKIKVTTFVDSAMHEAIEKSNIVLIGADAIIKSGVINKIGSTAIAEISKVHKKPLYIILDSWKFYSKNIKIENRSSSEVWQNPPKNIKIENPVFEKIPSKYIRAVISEFGILNHNQFIKKAKKIKF